MGSGPCLSTTDKQTYGLMRLPTDASSLKKVSNQQLTTLGNTILMIHVYLYPRMNYSTLGESFGLKS